MAPMQNCLPKTKELSKILHKQCSTPMAKYADVCAEWNVRVPSLPLQPNPLLPPSSPSSPPTPGLLHPPLHPARREKEPPWARAHCWSLPQRQGYSRIRARTVLGAYATVVPTSIGPACRGACPKGDSNAHGARLVHQKYRWIRTSRLSIKNSLSLPPLPEVVVRREPVVVVFVREMFFRRARGGRAPRRGPPPPAERARLLRRNQDDNNI